MDQAILEPGELDSLITDLEERISEVRLSDANPMAFSQHGCSVLACSVLAFCDDDGDSY
ncbi:hypothetical protein [Saccharothrix syringae]|uniref:hypothetical protein n=1 Tax=Saccharothrix syringae TaxID=103733 RepID=UPI000AA85B8B|nr:hypothetical protein [Saccharothrix syringae]